MVNNQRSYLRMNLPEHLIPSQESRSWNFVQKLNEEGVTIVMITHDPHIASIAKRMVKIIDGEIFEGDEKEDAS